MSALAITLTLAASSYIEWSEVPQTARMLLLADSLGVLLVYPTYHAFKAPAWERPPDLVWPLVPAGPLPGENSSQ